MATVREIAKQAGVSKTTVSMVLNNREGVSEATRKRVRAAIENLQLLEEARISRDLVQNGQPSLVSTGGYLPEAENQPQTLLVLHPNNLRSSKVFYEIIHGVQAGAALYHLQLTLAINDPRMFGEHYENLYLSDPILHPCGVVVIGARTHEPVVDQIVNLGIPVVLVGRRANQRGVSSVGRDEELVAGEATEYLIGLGHRDIAFLGGSMNYAYTAERLAGYQLALQRNGLRVNERYILLGFEECTAANLLLNNPQITGAVIVNELFASKVIPLIQSVGKIIPDDLSVVTFDDTEVSRNFNPPLTSVSLPLFQEGFWSVRVLMEQIRQPLLMGVQVTMKAGLAKRESCAPPRKDRVAMGQSSH